MANSFDILHHGAVNGVTGSAHELVLDEQNSLLIDCGLFQGSDSSPGGGAHADNLDIDFPVHRIRALIVTHVHIDHVGRIPWLLAAGFDGPILCSTPSARLLPIVLEDAFRLGFSRRPREVNRYLSMIESRLVPLPYNQWQTVVSTSDTQARIRLQRAGHILGSAYVECDVTTVLTRPNTADGVSPSGSNLFSSPPFQGRDHLFSSPPFQGGDREGVPSQSEGQQTTRHPEAQTKRIIFSGDLGAPHAPLLPPPAPPEYCDTLVIESTYGDRNHEDREQRRKRLEAVLVRALADKGTVLIPAFSIGRTQELLYELEDIIHQQQNNPVGETDLNWNALPIILDSPLASRFTQAYRELRPFWEQEAIERVLSGRRPLGFEQLLTVDDHDAHLRMVRHLADSARPAVVISGSGMCTGGRIINYLKAMLGDPRHNVLFVGYQGVGTPGRAIQHFGPRGGYVELDGARYDIRAGVETIGGYSAHADQAGLVAFATGMQRGPAEIRILHGDADAKGQLAARLAASWSGEDVVPGIEVPTG